MPSVIGSTPRESSTSLDAALAELVESYLARLQAGEAIDPNVFVAEHPEHAERLARLLPALDLMDDLRRSSIHPGSGLSLTPVLMEAPGVAPGLSNESVLRLSQRLMSRGSSPSHHVIRQELRDRLQAALAKLAPGDREILVMRNLEQMPADEIAAVLGIKEGTVRVRHLRALERLRGLLDLKGEEDF